MLLFAPMMVEALRCRSRPTFYACRMFVSCVLKRKKNNKVKQKCILLQDSFNAIQSSLQDVHARTIGQADEVVARAVKQITPT